MVISGVKSEPKRSKNVPLQNRNTSQFLTHWTDFFLRVSQRTFGNHARPQKITCLFTFDSWNQTEEARKIEIRSSVNYCSWQKNDSWLQDVVIRVVCTRPTIILFQTYSLDLANNWLKQTIKSTMKRTYLYLFSIMGTKKTHYYNRASHIDQKREPKWFIDRLSYFSSSIGLLYIDQATNNK